jgi:hypothetical protein
MTHRMSNHRERAERRATIGRRPIDPSDQGLA